MMKYLVLILLLIVSSVSAQPTTGTFVTTDNSFANLRECTWSFSPNASGTALSDWLDFNGQIVELTTIPSDGATSPSANYDVTLIDSHGIDRLNGYGLNRSQELSEVVVPKIREYDADTSSVTHSPIYLYDRLRLSVVDAGTTVAATAVRLKIRVENQELQRLQR